MPRSSQTVEVSLVGRLVQINFALWHFIVWLALTRLGLIRPRISPALRFSATLDGLGTTFVKLGQGLAAHRELLSDDYVNALEKLQDQVTPFSSELAIAELEVSLGKTVEEVFSFFDSKPLAAGSVAQVHRAIFRDGREVIVKIRRPGLVRQIRSDVRILRWVIRFVIIVIPSLKKFSPLELIDELARNLSQELQFRHESANIIRFCQIFQNSQSIYIPRVFEQYTTDWVLVQEFSHGHRIDDPVLVDDGPRLANVMVDAFVYQFFVAGSFHGDPHPGNLFVMTDGKICLHDFGLIGFLDRSTRISLASFMQAFAQQDADWLLDASLDLGLLAGSMQRQKFKAELDRLTQEYARKPLKDWSFGEALLSIARMGSGGNLRLPHHLLVLMRTIFLLESLIRHLDPHFNLLEGLFEKAGKSIKSTVQPDEAELMARIKYESLVSMSEFPRVLAKVIHRARSDGLTFTFHHEGLHELTSELRRASSRVGLSLLALGLYIAASLLMQHSAGPRLLGVPLLALVGYVLAFFITLRLLFSFTNLP